MSNKLISMKQLLERIPLSKTEIYRRISDGRFPQPHRIGQRRIAFLESEVSAWITDQVDNDQNDGGQQ